MVLMGILVLIIAGFYFGFANLLFFFKILIFIFILAVIGYVLFKIKHKFRKKAKIIPFSDIQDKSPHSNDHDNIYIKIFIDNYTANLVKGNGGIALRFLDFTDDLVKKEKVKKGKVFVYFNENKNTKMALVQRTHLKFFGQADQNENFKQRIRNVWGTF